MCYSVCDGEPAADARRQGEGVNSLSKFVGLINSPLGHRTNIGGSALQVGLWRWRWEASRVVT